MTYAQRSTLKSSECDRITIPRGLTCCGQHGAGEEQGGHEVPVPLAFVPHHRHPVVTGLERAGQQLLQARVGHAAVVAQEVAPRRLQLAAELLLVGPLDGGEDPGADQQVEDVTDNQQRKIQRGLASLHKPSAPAVAAAADHHVPVNGARALRWLRVIHTERKTVCVTSILSHPGDRIFLILHLTETRDDVTHWRLPKCMCVYVCARLFLHAPLQPVKQV